MAKPRFYLGLSAIIILAISLSSFTILVDGQYTGGGDNGTTYNFYSYYDDPYPDDSGTLIFEPTSLDELMFFADPSVVGCFNEGRCFAPLPPMDESDLVIEPSDDESNGTEPEEPCDTSMWAGILDSAQQLRSQMPTCYSAESDFLKKIKDLWADAGSFFANMFDANIDDLDCFAEGWTAVNHAMFQLHADYFTITDDCVDTGPTAAPPVMLDTDACCDVDNGTGWWSNLTIPWLTTSPPESNCVTSPRPPMGRRATAPPCFLTTTRTTTQRPPPNGRRSLASVTTQEEQQQQQERAEGVEPRADPPCPPRLPGLNVTFIGAPGTNPRDPIGGDPPSGPQTCRPLGVIPNDRTMDPLRKAFPNEASWKAYQKLRQELLASKKANRELLKGIEQPKGTKPWKDARDAIVKVWLTGNPNAPAVAALIDNGAIRFEFSETSPYMDRIVIKNEVMATSPWGALNIDGKVIIVSEADAAPGSLNLKHEIGHEVNAVVEEAIYGKTANPRPRVMLDQAQIQKYYERYLYDEIKAQCENIGKPNGGTWESLSRDLQRDYCTVPRNTLRAIGAALYNDPALEAAEAAAVQKSQELIGRLAEMERLAQTLVDRGLLADKSNLGEMMKRMMQTRSTPDAFLELWKGLTQEQLIKLAERVPVEQWGRLQSRQQIDNILNRSPLKQALIKYGPGTAGAGFAFSLLELYVTDGFDKDKWHEILPKPIPFIPVSMSQIFKGILPNRWLAYQTQDLGRVGTAFAVTGTTTAELALLVGYDKLLTPVGVRILQGVGAQGAAATLGRFGLLRILGPVTVPFMAWFAPEMAGAPSVLGANTDQTLRMSVWAVVGGAMGGGFATGGPIGAAAGALVGATVLFGRALVEYRNVVREGPTMIRRQGVHITMMHARNGLLRHDNSGPDNVVTEEARQYFTEYAQGVLLGLLVDNKVIGVDRLQQLRAGDAIRIYELCKELETNPTSSSRQRELNRIITGVDSVDTALTNRVKGYYAQAKDYYTQMENIYKRAVRIHYEPTGDKWTATHDLVAINDAFKAAGMSTATAEQQRDWLINRLPLIADLMSNERRQTGGYIQNYAPDIYNSLFCTQLRNNFTNAEELATQARIQLSQPWVLRRLGPALGTLWLQALNGERSLTDEQLKECMKLLNKTMPCPAAQRKDEQKGRAKAMQSFRNASTPGGVGGSNNRRDLLHANPTFEEEMKVMKAQMLLGGGFSQMEPTIIEAGEAGNFMTQYGDGTVLQFRRDASTGFLKVAAFRTASPTDFSSTTSSSTSSTSSTPSAATFYNDLQWILDHKADMDGFLEFLEESLRLNNGAEMDWTTASMIYPDLPEILTNSEIHTDKIVDTLFLVLHAFAMSETDAALSAYALEGVWTGYWKNPVYNIAGVSEDNVHVHRFIQMTIAGVRRLVDSGVVVTANTMSYVTNGLQSYALAGFPSLPPV